MIYTPFPLLQLGDGRGRLIGRWAGLPVRAGEGVHVCVCMHWGPRWGCWLSGWQVLSEQGRGHAVGSQE